MAVSRAMVLRAAAHVAVWLPFLTAVAGSVRGGWRVVGDGAGIASQSWSALTAHGPLVGHATQLAHGLYDPGPLEFWLLAVPVHADPVRGVLWGAALWCMAAGSLAIEAMWSVHGQTGGVLASGTILWTLAWRPGIVIKPYWNPWLGTMFFLAALAAGWAVMSGRRWWWPVLVITASVAAQAHLMFALASAAVVLLALITGLADASRRTPVTGGRQLVLLPELPAGLRLSSSSLPGRGGVTCPRSSTSRTPGSAPASPSPSRRSRPRPSLLPSGCFRVSSQMWRG